MKTIPAHLALGVQLDLGDAYLEDYLERVLGKAGPDGALQSMLSQWSRVSTKPLVLLIDEIDTLLGDTLISVLRQLRAGYGWRPHGFPQSVIVCYFMLT